MYANGTLHPGGRGGERIVHAEGVAKKHARRSSHCHHHSCRLFNLAVVGRISVGMGTLAEPTDARWFNVLSALCEGVLGPVLALSAIALSVTNRRLLLATILAILAGVIYVAPLAAFFIGIM